MIGALMSALGDEPLRHISGAAMSDLVTTEQDGAVLIIRLNRPGARNAINFDCAQALANAFEKLDSDDTIRIGVLTGEGGHFSAGMDLKDFAASGRRPRVPGRGFAGFTEQPPVKPLIAAVEGYALAGGFEMVLACDLVVAANTAMFGLPEVKRGLIAGAGGLLRLPQRLPYHLAMEAILTGDHMTAARMHAFGLINTLTEPGQALTEARMLAQKIAANGPLAVQLSKQVVSQGIDWSQDEMFAKQVPFMEKILASQDAKEGALAFAQKRTPIWRGQ
jgi:enoyl-CoA hydratase